jgi:hypothetical protein
VCIIFCIANSAAGDSLDFSNKIQKLGDVQLTGWARLRGELIIYADRNSMEKQLKYPRCVSGVFSNQSKRKLSSYDGRDVNVSGTLVRYANLQNEDNSVLPRKVLFGSIIPNFCFGDKVLLIKNIATATRH